MRGFKSRFFWFEQFVITSMYQLKCTWRNETKCNALDKIFGLEKSINDVIMYICKYPIKLKKIGL